MEESNTSTKAHKMISNNRRNCSVNGVTDVISFDLNQVLMETEYGMLTIKGHDLHVGKLSVDKGELEVDGTIDALQYSDMESLTKKSEGFLNRLFK